MNKQFFKELLFFESEINIDFKILDIHSSGNLYELKLLMDGSVFDELVVKSDLAFMSKKWLFDKGYQVNTRFLKTGTLKTQASVIDENGNEIVKITSDDREENIILKLAERIYYIENGGSKNGD